MFKKRLVPIFVFCFVDLFLLRQKWTKFNQMEFYLFTGIYKKPKEN